ncbi:hypothetical protein [Paractinoplanes atraurantiacus]|uniref:Translation initiation factor 2 n=1 Tax=Paractinoplanes atraurantiacus TaxID=1036182 RepID=A0A285F7W5_9ACTN|nr:hypothetical protein [Actinoplanes atraurantiacus]SNY06774.1 hypothetical protein SAMN05421748_101774 [Actinoplanes atraurantiacus]
MPDKYFASADTGQVAAPTSAAPAGSSLRDSIQSATERVLWSGKCAVAEYAFDEPASMPRWTLPEETEVVVTEERVLYRDPVTLSTGELRWPWPQHLRVQPGNRDAGRSGTVTQIQLVCAGPHNSFPALVFAGGDLAAVGDADRLANTLRQAIARYRVEHATELGIPVMQARMLSRLVIGPEFNNFQGGDGQTVTLIGAVSVQRLAAEPQQPQNPWVASAYAPPASDAYAKPAPPAHAAPPAYDADHAASSAYATPDHAARPGYAPAPHSAPPVVSGPPAAAGFAPDAAGYAANAGFAPAAGSAGAAAGSAPVIRAATPASPPPPIVPAPAPAPPPVPAAALPTSAAPTSPAAGRGRSASESWRVQPADDNALRGRDDLDSRAASLAARVADLVSGGAETGSTRPTGETNLSAFLERPVPRSPEPPPYGGASSPTSGAGWDTPAPTSGAGWEGGDRAESVRRTAARFAGNAARSRGSIPRQDTGDIPSQGNHRQG